MELVERPAQGKRAGMNCWLVSTKTKTATQRPRVAVLVCPMSDMLLSCRDATNQARRDLVGTLEIRVLGWLRHDKTEAYRTLRQ